jgi:hypothetical protein
VLSGLIGQFRLRNASGPRAPRAEANGAAYEQRRDDTPRIVLGAGDYGGVSDKY